MDYLIILTNFTDYLRLGCFVHLRALNILTHFTIDPFDFPRFFVSSIISILNLYQYWLIDLCIDLPRVVPRPLALTQRIPILHLDQISLGHLLLVLRCLLPFEERDVRL